MDDSRLLSLGFCKEICLNNTYHGLILEATKGSIPGVFTYPVELEPYYEKFTTNKIFFISDNQPEIANRAKKLSHKINLIKIFFPLSEKMDWQSYEEGVRSLSGIKEKMSFEIIGNESKIEFFLTTAKKGTAKMIGECWRSFLPELNLVNWNDAMPNTVKPEDIWFADIFPPPPIYSKTTDCYEFSTSPLLRLLPTFAKIKEPNFGFYQVLFQPLEHDWASNMQQLLEGASTLGNHSPFGKPAREQVKAFSTQPLYAVRVRIGGFCVESWFEDAIKMFVGIFKSGGSNFLLRTKDNFNQVISPKESYRMFLDRSTYTTGMILTSSELATFVHLPDASIENHPEIRCDYVKGFPVPKKLQADGLPLGINTYQGKTKVVHIPSSAGNPSLYIIGSSTYGKSTSLINQMLSRIRAGCGVGLIDFHGETVQELLNHIPVSAIDRCVYINPADEDYIPCLNQFQTDKESDWGKLVGDYVESLKGMFGSGWGHRMAHFMGKALFGLFVLGRNFADIPLLLSRTAHGERLRSEIVQKTKNAEVRRFFQEEFHTYGPEAFSPVINKFSNLLLDERILRLFSVRENRVNIQDVMDKSMIFLADLSIGKLGPEVAPAIGGMLVAQFQKVALNRASIPPDKRRPFFLFLEEFHRLLGFSVVESIINECRKYGLYVTLTHQETGQIPDEVLKALRSVANIMVFNTNIDDARKMVHLFNDKVLASDIIGLDVGEVYARISNCVVNFKTFPPLVQKVGDPAKIIQQSREKYYIKAEDFQKSTSAKKREYDTF